MSEADTDLDQEAQDAALDEPIDERELEGPRRRGPGYFLNWPSNEQMEYFKRGGR